MKVTVTEASSVPSSGGGRMNQHPCDLSIAVYIFMNVTPYKFEDIPQHLTVAFHHFNVL